MFIASATICEARGEHLAIQFLWAIARLLITSVSTIFLIDEFLFFLPAVPSPQTYTAASWVV